MDRGESSQSASRLFRLQAERAQAPRGSFDLRRASALYSNISAVLAGFALTALTVILTRYSGEATPDAITFSVGLFGIALVGNTFTAFNYAAIGAANTPTPRLLSALYLVGLASATTGTSIFAGLAVLANEALGSQGITVFFALGTAGGGIGAVMFLSFAVSDTLRSFGTPNRTVYPKSAQVPDDPFEADRLQWRPRIAATLIIVLSLAVSFTLPRSWSSLGLAYGWVLVGGTIASLACLASLVLNEERLGDDGRLGWLSVTALQLTVGVYVGGLLLLLPIGHS